MTRRDTGARLEGEQRSPRSLLVALVLTCATLIALDLHQNLPQQRQVVFDIIWLARQPRVEHTRAQILVMPQARRFGHA